jgi:hypothetical protein
MDEIIGRVWNDFLARTTGPMWFRLILQPAVAAVFGVRAGLRNARREASRSQPAQTLDPAYRRAMLRQALHDVGKVLIAGIGLDVIFQLIALRALYPIEAVLVGFLLVALPYQIVRTVVARLASKS